MDSHIIFDKKILPLYLSSKFNKIPSNKFIDLLIKKTNKFIFNNNLLDKYKKYKRQLTLNTDSLSYQILNKIKKFNNKMKFIEWYNLNSYEVYDKYHLISEYITNNNIFERFFRIKENI